MERDKVIDVVPEGKEIMSLDGCGDLKMAAKAQLDLNNFIASMMKEGVDYGMIPGTKKKSLYQPGGQKLLYFNGLGVKMECTEKSQDWEKGFFHYEYKAIAFHKRTGIVVAECFGSANSKEDRYAWRWVTERNIPRGFDKDSLPSKQRSGKNGDYTVYRTPNPDLFTLPNTLQKMAQKRSMVGVSTLACRASENFTTQYDEEDALDSHGAAPKEKEGAPDHTKNERPKSGQAAKPPAEKQAPKTGGSADDPSLISEKQKKRLFAIQKGANVSDEELQQYLFEKYDYVFDAEGKMHKSRIKKGDDYKAICDWVEWKGQQAPE